MSPRRLRSRRCPREYPRPRRLAAKPILLGQGYQNNRVKSQAKNPFQNSGAACTTTGDLSDEPERSNSLFVMFHSRAQHEPEPAIGQFPDGVEVPGVAGRLRHHMQDDLPHGVQPPVAKEVLRPPGWRRVERRAEDDGVGELCLPTIRVEY